MSNQRNSEAVVQRFNEIKQEIAAKAFSDGDFRERLLANPNTTITSEYGLPDGALKTLNINIYEEQPGVLTIPIPPSIDDIELTDEQLEQVAGGGIIMSIFITLNIASGSAAFAGAYIAFDSQGDKNYSGW